MLTMLSEKPLNWGREQISSLAARALPTFAVSIFLLFRKELDYAGSFARYPDDQNLETNFFAGG